MSVKSLEDLFIHTLKDIYFAENHLVKALPKMAKHAGDERLKLLFEEHLEETETQVERLEKVFASLDMSASGEECPAILGITEEAEELMEEIEDSNTLDAALIAAAQAVEHYEITRYGTLVSWAEELGYSEVATLLKTTLDEEKSADHKLTKLGENNLNKRAA